MVPPTCLNTWGQALSGTFWRLKKCWLICFVWFENKKIENDIKVSVLCLLVMCQFLFYFVSFIHFLLLPLKMNKISTILVQWKKAKSKQGLIIMRWILFQDCKLSCCLHANGLKPFFTVFLRVKNGKIRCVKMKVTANASIYTHWIILSTFL